MENQEKPVIITNIAGQKVNLDNILWQESFVEEEIPIEAYEDELSSR